MVNVINNLFHISTKDTSLILRVDESNHLVLDYYGKLIPNSDNYKAILEKWPFAHGSSTIVDTSITGSTSLDLISLEYSSIGKGDYNEPSLILKNEHGYVFDFTYDRYTYNKGQIKIKELPSPHGECEILTIFVSDKTANIALELNYFIFEETNIIARNIIIKNRSLGDVTILKAMSMQMELINDSYELINLFGGWACENNKEFTPIKHGIYINDSKTGNSSNRHNPFFMMKQKEASLNNGSVFAFNFIYSGNHYEMVELTTYEKVRLQIGINPYCFEKNLKVNDSHNMHQFINEHVIKENFKYISRPIIVNNWEATMMKFTESKLISIAKEAKNNGVEMFVLDDGWFINRNDDKNGLGDYEVDKNKLPSGLSGLAKKINKLGLKFGLWVEPEMVNEGSNLYKAHPDWAIKANNRKPALGRNQLVLDLTKKEVRIYILKSLDDLLNSANIEYIKWDMNRNMSDMEDSNGLAGGFFHNYILGLYQILDEITKRHPNVLFEGCASGGNRFDLGILSYMEQNWTSDDTDAYQRIKIQSGIALGYPLSVISNHVSGATSQQLLRKIPLETRFNVASFGIIGYEFDLKNLNSVERKELKSQILFYKKHRELLQFGDFYQLSFMEDRGFAIWEVISKDRSEAIIGYFNSLQTINHGITILKGINFIDDAIYQMDVREQKNNLKTFGNLVNMVSKVHLNEEGFLLDTMPGEKESYICSGAMINNGAIKLNQEWASIGFSEEVRVLGDFGSRLYYFKKIK